MTELWLNDEISVPVEYLDYNGYPIQSEWLGEIETGEQVWITLPHQE